MKWRTYPAYRDSGVEWLGEIPERWDMRRLRLLLKDYEGIKIGPFGSALRLEYMQEDGYKVYGQEHLINADFSLGHKYIHEDKFKELIMCEILPGDVVVSMMGTTGKCQVVPEIIERGIMDSHLLRLRPNESVFPFYLASLINDSDYIRYQITRNSKGSIMEGLNSFIIKELLVALPSLPEQQAIATLLDRETGRIDELLAKKQRQIELLQEKRSALISHVVTKGLDPNAKMKDSGVEWLGEIPEHWGAIRFKFLLDEPLQYGANESAEYDETAWPRYVRITDINENGNLREETFKSLPEDIAQPYLLRDGDLLLARSGATVGKTFLYLKSWGRAAYAGYLIRARLEHKCMLPTFCSYFCRSNNYWDWLKSSFIQATIQNVSAERYANMVVPRPPINEQQAIMAFLDRETSRIDQLIDKVSKSIDLLREYRTALISAAVTGKIDVREEAPAS